MKTLIFDIETSPMLANIWSLWNEARDFKFVDVDWYVLSWSAKWLDEKKHVTKALPDYKGYTPGSTDDLALVTDLWKLFDEADIVVAHNAKKFDCKKMNTRFILNGLLPPSPYKIIDTLEVAKRHFKFSSNRLDTIGQMLGVGRKATHEGFGLWRDCMNGKKSAWKKMKSYNKQDVVLLEKIFYALRPYTNNIPNFGAMNGIASVCPCCGSNDLMKQGYAYTNTSKYQRYRCNSCGKWSRDKTNLIDIKIRRDTLTNII